MVFSALLRAPACVAGFCHLDEEDDMHTRRQFIVSGTRLVAAGAVATAVGPTIHVRDARAAGQLKILQWSHFVPAYDKWFDPWAKEWGSKRGIEVTVDHVGFADVVPRATAEVAAQSGHDIHMFLGLASAFEEHVIDLGDVVATLEKKHGKEVELARRSTYNPFTRKQFALSDMWVPDPGNYHKEVWTKIGMPNGPVTYDDLVKAAPEIKKAAPQMQIPIGIGLSQDIDSNMAVRNILWCHGGSIQDKDGNVVLNSPETLAALEYTKKLYSVGMTQAVLSWNAASNNQAFNAQETAYILNSISAYRTAQDNKLPVIENYYFVPALKGPKATLASEHVMSGYVVWKFSKNQDAAKEFLVALVDASRESMHASKLYNFPSFYGAAAEAGTPVAKRPESGAAWIAAQCNKDPFGSIPADKLALLARALPWSTNLGYPGYGNPAEGEIFDTYVLTDMFAKAATGALSPKDAMAEASTRARQIFDKWRQKKMVPGGGKDK
jgi:ABC-type glycerol-3-phosphate transport system substrate-binding protein